jgi:hypothetical protein
MPNTEILTAISQIGYDTSNNLLTFQKGCFSPQWRFLIHTLLHCLSPKRTSWEQFSSNIAIALVCLSGNKKYNFSKVIFESLVKNSKSPHKFLMYPKFIQLILKAKQSVLLPHKRIFPTPCLQQEVFQNMAMATQGWDRVVRPLSTAMLASIPQVQGEGSVNPTEPQHTPIVVPSTSHTPTVTYTYRR